uniref:Uncharacterized protein n=1 Tax=Arundo donax TaxID=35708 RepID=A0A0A9D7U3_ARUDO
MFGVSIKAITTCKDGTQVGMGENFFILSLPAIKNRLLGKLVAIATISRYVPSTRLTYITLSWSLIGLQVR